MLPKKRKKGKERKQEKETYKTQSSFYSLDGFRSPLKWERSERSHEKFISNFAATANKLNEDDDDDGAEEFEAATE